MSDLDVRLTALGDRLDLVTDGLVDDVLVRLDSSVAEPDGGHRRRRLWLAAAALLIVVVAVTAAVPSSRRAVADWFGFDGVRIERDPALSVPTTIDDSSDAGHALQIESFDGALVPEAITKVLGPGTSVREVDVDGALGIWIEGAPHELVIRDEAGDLVARRIAGNTLLWQDGDVVRRLEGAPSLEAALEIATADE